MGNSSAGRRAGHPSEYCHDAAVGRARTDQHRPDGGPGAGPVTAAAHRGDRIGNDGGPSPEASDPGGDSIPTRRRPARRRGRVGSYLRTSVDARPLNLPSARARRHTMTEEQCFGTMEGSGGYGCALDDLTKKAQELRRGETKDTIKGEALSTASRPRTSAQGPRRRRPRLPRGHARRSTAAKIDRRPRHTSTVDRHRSPRRADFDRMGADVRSDAAIRPLRRVGRRHGAGPTDPAARRSSGSRRWSAREGS
jgi:hypothetical protein